MKVIIAGSRSIRSPALVASAVAGSGFQVDEVVSGGAPGVDTLGEEWAERHGVPMRRFSARWEVFGRSAGYRRNTQMGEYADALVAVHDGESRGTAHMIDVMKRLGKPVFVETVRPDGRRPRKEDCQPMLAGLD